jgi:hypothetical protein
VSKFVESLKLSSHCQAILAQFMLYGPFVEQKLKFKLRYCWYNQISRIAKKRSNAFVLASLCSMARVLYESSSYSSFILVAGSAKANGREPKTCLGRVFHYKSGHLEDVCETQVCRSTPTSVVENSAQVSSC